MNSKLTPEQQVVADRWERERALRSVAIDEMTAAKTDSEYKEAMRKYSEASGPQMCEHERHWSSHCSECDEIARILYPLQYEDKEDEDEIEDEKDDTE